ncbi:PASTA domain-containing protein [Kitasatospora acidiphila]|uniref:PASTA domain-containing protein n=1 Tax=Kitasatospora acidiphila TaxID=2567942 RepID=A0A540WEP1_9ACTN|nr:PASTA domain-containing protein [Kitasatospora acidiphila]
MAGSVVVPAVIGQSEATARQVLAAAGLQVGTVHDFTDWHTAAGLVISTQPAAGASVPGGTVVNLFVSKGKP